jgi:uncharacterized surface protein with fasciclin (FAS1) repeats
MTHSSRCRRTARSLVVGVVAMAMAALASGQEVTWEAAPVDDPYRADAMAPMPAMPPEGVETMPAPAPAAEAPTVSERTVVDVAIEDARFSTLTTALVAVPEVMETLEQPGPWTVFAPTNEAIMTFLAENGLTAEELLASPGLGDVLKKHVVAGQVTGADLAQAVAQGPIPLTTLWGAVDARQVDGSLIVGGATVVQADIFADNGVIHVVDRVVA